MQGISVPISFALEIFRIFGWLVHIQYVFGKFNNIHIFRELSQEISVLFFIVLAKLKRPKPLARKPDNSEDKRDSSHVEKKRDGDMEKIIQYMNLWRKWCTISLIHLIPTNQGPASFLWGNAIPSTSYKEEQLCLRLNRFTQKQA